MKGTHTPPNDWCMAFELSLQDRALHWYRQLPRKTRRTWKLLSDAFINGQDGGRRRDSGRNEDSRSNYRRDDRHRDESPYRPMITLAEALSDLVTALNETSVGSQTSQQAPYDQECDWNEDSFGDGERRDDGDRYSNRGSEYDYASEDERGHVAAANDHERRAAAEGPFARPDNRRHKGDGHFNNDRGFARDNRNVGQQYGPCAACGGLTHSVLYCYKRCKMCKQVHDQRVSGSAHDGPSPSLLRFRHAVRTVREWLRLPFGLCNALQIYQRQRVARFWKLSQTENTRDVFKDGIPSKPGTRSVLSRQSYIDDILIGCTTWDDLCKSEEWHLSISVEKSEWGMSKVGYLGHEVSEDGLGAKPKNLETLATLEFPRTQKGLQSFLGSLNYYHRFILDFAIYAAALYSLSARDFEERVSNPETRDLDKWTHA
ncbi:LOW QUALITY PROTEIN: reverse transcriptase [Phytophthora megakarya]|uniref:Reverse transcriptase n=1 Tax=Phytophthora megakarya TaxID=4795 RepID=A0A225V5L8_9STRA|nr:LOW QUALITY PROTEIN: reverse transcriptase [Phytophthora megakarya]